MKKIAPILEELYDKYNNHELIPPDPVQYVYHFDDRRDREIVGLIASSLAYGKVELISKAIKSVLDRMPSPYEFLSESTMIKLQNTFEGFKYRFNTGEHISKLLYAIKGAIDCYGSLEDCFLAGYSREDETTINALTGFVEALTEFTGERIYYLLPSPTDKSACKRLNLFLKWMVRSDNVDPGVWNSVPASKLIMPVDVHIHRICYTLGLTLRKSADLKTALEITRSFRDIIPDDPVKYDFALARMGMLKNSELADFYERCGEQRDLNAA